MTRARTALLTGALILAWGSTFAAIKIGLESSPPLQFAGLRAVLGGAVMALVALHRNGWPVLTGRTRQYAVLTVLNVVLFLGLQTLALGELPSGLAAVLIYLQPPLVTLLAWRFLGERLTTRVVAGLALGVAGVAAVGSGALAGDVSGVGVLLAVASAVAWAFGTIAFKQSAGIDLLWAVALPFLVGGVLLLVVGVVVEPAVEWTPGFVAALAYAGLVGTALAWTLWFGLVGAGDAGRAAAYIFLVPVVGVLAGVVVLGEDLTAPVVAGAVLIAAGVYLVNRQRMPMP